MSEWKELFTFRVRNRIPTVSHSLSLSSISPKDPYDRRGSRELTLGVCYLLPSDSCSWVWVETNTSRGLLNGSSFSEDRRISKLNRRITLLVRYCGTGRQLIDLSGGRWGYTVLLRGDREFNFHRQSMNKFLTQNLNTMNNFHCI